MRFGFNANRRTDDCDGGISGSVDTLADVVGAGRGWGCGSTTAVVLEVSMLDPVTAGGASTTASVVATGSTEDLAEGLGGASTRSARPGPCKSNVAVAAATAVVAMMTATMPILVAAVPGLVQARTGKRC